MKHVISTIFLIIGFVHATIAVLDRALSFLVEGQAFGLMLCAVCSMTTGLGFAYLESKFGNR